MKISYLKLHLRLNVVTQTEKVPEIITKCLNPMFRLCTTSKNVFLVWQDMESSNIYPKMFKFLNEVINQYHPACLLFLFYLPRFVIFWFQQSGLKLLSMESVFFESMERSWFWLERTLQLEPSVWVAIASFGMLNVEMSFKASVTQPATSYLTFIRFKYS